MRTNQPKIQPEFPDRLRVLSEFGSDASGHLLAQASTTSAQRWPTRYWEKHIGTVISFKYLVQIRFIDY